MMEFKELKPFPRDGLFMYGVSILLFRNMLVNGIKFVFWRKPNPDCVFTVFKTFRMRRN